MVSSVNNNSGSYTPADHSFTEGLKGKSNEDLQKMSKDPKLSTGEKMAVLEELAKRTGEEMKAEEAGGGGDPAEGGSDELAELMKKLKNGTITPEELDKLAGMMKMDPKDLEAAMGGGEDDKEENPDNV
ncbi:hypothetical protein ACFOLJ_03020 [Rugamonas sp. CCM 8940]|uniref:hypothetical protein n=1 Tax=Rugamonas sp. CCM 8940 TaxID=2765359 RepID=UPI0018F51C31|nr:hypothetical protein [Rugamonas sp. CCM 8940]MBJ7311912.1 hypothetical protein [Rugamonas sp. CCM 8940]